MLRPFTALSPSASKDSGGHRVAQAPTRHGHSPVSPQRWREGGLESPEGWGRREEAASSWRRASCKAVAPREQLHLRPAKALITTPSGSIRLCVGRSVLSRRESRISGRQRVRGAGLQAPRPGRALWSPVSSHLGDPNWSPWDRPSVARTPPATTGPPVQWRSRVFDRDCACPLCLSQACACPPGGPSECPLSLRASLLLKP